MSEPLQNTTDSPETSGGEDYTSLAERSQAEGFERRVRRYGPRSDDPKPEETPAAPPPAASRQETIPRAPREGFRDRQAGRRYTQKLEGELAELKSLVQSLVPKPPPEEAPDAQQDPEGWSRWVIKNAVKEAIGEPVIQHLDQTRTLAEQQRQEQELTEANRAALSEFSDDMTGWEDDYRERFPDAAQGYEERLKGFMVSGVEYHMALGDNFQDAYRNATLGLVALVQQAQARQLHPAAFLDFHFRKAIATNGGDPTVARRQTAQKTGNREMQERAAAAKKAGSSMQVKAPAKASQNGKGAALLAEARPNNAADLIRVARKMGGNVKENLRTLRAQMEAE